MNTPPPPPPARACCSTRVLLHAMCYALIVAPLLALSLRLNDAPALASGGDGPDPPAASQSDIDAYTDSLQAIHEAMFGSDAGLAPVNWEVTNDPTGSALDLLAVEGSFSTTLYVDQTLETVAPGEFDIPDDAAFLSVENARLINATAFPAAPLLPVSVTAFMYTVEDTTTGETLTLLNFFGFTDDIFPPEIMDDLARFNDQHPPLCAVGPNGQTSCYCLCEAAFQTCLQDAYDDAITCMVFSGIRIAVAIAIAIALCIGTSGIKCALAGAGAAIYLAVEVGDCLYQLATDITRCQRDRDTCLAQCAASGSPSPVPPATTSP